MTRPAQSARLEAQPPLRAQRPAPAAAPAAGPRLAE